MFAGSKGYARSPNHLALAKLVILTLSPLGTILNVNRVVRFLWQSWEYEQGHYLNSLP
jgi:hypothetical protein